MRSASDWREGFLFLGNDLCLDFINTYPELNEKPQELLTDWLSLMRWFQAADLIDSRQGRRFERRWARSKDAERTFNAMRSFRELLRKELLAIEGGVPIVGSATIQDVNHLMSQYPMLSKIKSEKDKLTMVRWFPLREPSDLFAPLAFAAANLLSKVDSGRVRKCEHCVLHFYDTSKIGTRRWCSMRLCGNRSKVAAYAARHGSSGD